MNKKEWKEERRKWRLINKSAFPDDSIYNAKDRDFVRDFLFSVVWEKAPRWFWSTQPRCFYHYRKIVDRIDIKINIENAPNSYPHPTKNP